jgi:hypothetical protein
MKSNYYKHPITGKIVEMESGFNLPLFLFGWIYLLYKGDFETAAIQLFLCCLLAFGGVLGLLGILFVNLWIGFKWNAQYTEHLIEKGYEKLEY